jgi:PPOX class probable F420-dependent enzyme
MTDVLHHGEPDRRLETETIAWLTTVSGSGQPQSSPVWFLWDGSSLWLRSQEGAGKVRNIEANPSVSIHLADDGHGGSIVTVEGTASIEDEPAELVDRYMGKYGDAIRDALGSTPEQVARDYPVTIRITPTRARAW